MAKSKYSNKEVQEAFEKAKEENPGLSDWKICGIVANNLKISANSVFQRIRKRDKPPVKQQPQPEIKPKQRPEIIQEILDTQEPLKKQKFIHPETFIGNKTGFRYRATGKGLLIQQVLNEKVGAIQVLSIEDFIQELQDCKSLF